MDIVSSVVIGVVQGVTEFLPISSTAHLKIIPALLGWKEPSAASSAVIQLGTVAAVLVYFAKDLGAITKGFLRSLMPQKNTVVASGDAVAPDIDPRQTTEARQGWAIILGTIPIIVVALLLKKFIENDFRSLYVIAGAQIVGALALYAADKLAPKTRTLDTITVKDGILVGIAQCFALVPGMSRSGSTMTGGFLTGLNREAATRFAFLLSVPATTLAGLFELKEVFKNAPVAPGEVQLSTPDLIIATLVSGLVGYASIAWLIKLLRTQDTLPFVVYRVLLGIGILLLLRQGILTP
ncbi:MAG: undecaprenyl-diphosphatase UppP [Armatimonadetes bacterium]|nr:undecaprenyl-diphosphatase UppP [Armatimonadota bacterium]